MRSNDVRDAVGVDVFEARVSVQGVADRRRVRPAELEFEEHPRTRTVAPAFEVAASTNQNSLPKDSDISSRYEPSFGHWESNKNMQHTPRFRWSTERRHTVFPMGVLLRFEQHFLNGLGIFEQSMRHELAVWTAHLATLFKDVEERVLFQQVTNPPL